MTAAMPLVWVDGTWSVVPLVSVFSHAINYASSVFDSVRLYSTPNGPAFFRLDDHVQRLYSAMAFAGFSCRFKPAQFKAACIAFARKNELESGYLRFNAFLPQEELRVFPDLRQASIGIYADWLDYTGRSFEAGVRCQLPGIRKAPSNVLPAGIKFSANYLPSYLALKDARAKKFDEAILLDSRGFVAEATAQNLFVSKSGALFTPSTRSEILPGITRDSVMALARDAGISVEEKDLSVQDLYDADEVFLTGTATELMPVTRIEHTQYRIGPLALLIKSAWNDVVSGRHRLSKKWLTYV